MRSIVQARRWFESRGIYDVLVERLHERGHSFEECFERDPRGLINSGITWALTREGSEFWREIHEDYVSWFNSQKAQIKSFEPKFNLKDKVIIKKDLQSEIVEVNEEMLGLCNKTVNIVNIDTSGYYPDSKTQDGCLYYIKEDKEINSWTSEMFEIKKI